MTDRRSRSVQLPLEFPDAIPGVVERSMPASGYVIGVDEVGRGPLAGPVTVCAVLISLDDVAWCEGVDDSKKLSAAARGALDLRIREKAAAFELVHVEHDEIDVLNILGATMAGMRRAVEGLRRATGAGLDVPVLIDGNRAPDGLAGRLRCIIGGDARSWAIGAASIIAKVSRDARMDAYDRRWPVYGFAGHKGYPTPAHRAALAEHGPCEVHRRSFAPVAAAMR